MSLSSAKSKEPGMGPKTEKPCSMTGLINRHKKPDSMAGFLKRFAAFTAVHAAMKPDLFRAENLFLYRARHNFLPVALSAIRLMDTRGHVVL